MKLLHIYSPDPRYAPQQEETWAALQMIEPVLLDRGWSVEHVPTGEGNEYEQAILSRWGSDDLLLLEHDIVPTLGALLALESCGEAVCAWAYRLHFADGTMKAVQWVLGKLPDLSPADREQFAGMVDLDWLKNFADRKRADIRGGCWEPFCHRVMEGGQVRWGSEHDTWADWAGFGLTRISLAFQRSHAPTWEPGRWGDLDGRFSNWLRAMGIRFHIHSPEVRHAHPCAQGYWACEPIGFGRVIQGPRPSRWAAMASLPFAQQVPEELERAMAAVEEMKPRVVLEVGVADGGTLASWAHCADDEALLVGIDASHVPDIPHGPGQRVVGIVGDSHSGDTLARVTEALGGRKVDWLFIDGDHSLQGVEADFAMYSAFVRAGGKVGFHDILKHPDPAQSRVDEAWAGWKSRYVTREIVHDPAQGWAGIGIIDIPATTEEG